MIPWDPEAHKGLRKMRWGEGLLEPGEEYHGALTTRGRTPCLSLHQPMAVECSSCAPWHGVEGETGAQTVQGLGGVDMVAA